MSARRGSEQRDSAGGGPRSRASSSPDPAPGAGDLAGEAAGNRAGDAAGESAGAAAGATAGESPSESAGDVRLWHRAPAEPAAAPGTQPGQGDAGQREEASSTLFHAERAQSDPDHPSWTDLLSRTEARVRRMLTHARPPAPYDLDDVVALTLERVYRHLPHLELRSRQSFWGWVRTVAEGALADLGRRALARKRGGKSSVQRLAAADDTTPGMQVPDHREHSASVLMRARELHDAMMQCLAGMLPETAEVLRLRLLEGCSHEAIATRIGRQHAVTVRTIFARGMRRLAACMREKGFDA